MINERYRISCIGPVGMATCKEQDVPYSESYSAGTNYSNLKYLMHAVKPMYYLKVYVKNQIHSCEYTMKEFMERYEKGQRRFIRSNHPTFKRWRPERRKKEDVQ